MTVPGWRCAWCRSRNAAVRPACWWCGRDIEEIDPRLGSTRSYPQDRCRISEQRKTIATTNGRTDT